MKKRKRTIPKRWTEEEDRLLKEKYGELNAKELAIELDRSLHSVKKRLGILSLKMPPTIYTVYKGDDVIAEGTAQECADKLNVTKRYIQWMATEEGFKRISCYVDSESATIAFKQRAGRALI